MKEKSCREKSYNGIYATFVTDIAKEDRGFLPEPSDEIVAFTGVQVIYRRHDVSRILRKKRVRR